MNDTPANICHPTWFVEKATEYLSGLDNVELIVREESWAIEQKMGAFMSVAYGSDQPAKFLEIHYKGGEGGDTPLVYIGKGITFDTGGISKSHNEIMEDGSVIKFIPSDKLRDVKP